ncbi:MAG: phosphatidylserine decarboxylase, partial [Planctomycetes bacterium RBG_16_59_8]
PFAEYAVREILLFSLLWILVGVAAVIWLHPLAATLPLALLVFTLCFFRDPWRAIPEHTDVLLSPADGKIVELREVEEEEFLKGPCVKVGIFLSVFNVHINRAPWSGRVAETSYRKGKFLNALFERSSVENESNAIVIADERGRTKVLVRQIAGAIARRIVCACRPGDRVERGQKIGMIKFGSRTELYVPLRGEGTFEPAVRVGDKVKAGETILGSYRI